MLTYTDLLAEVQMFCDHGIETGNMGDSTMGQRIPYIFVGQKTGNYMIVQCAIHAREHITSLLGLLMAKHLVATKSRLEGGIYIVPMVNVDGVRLCQEGMGWVKDKTVKNHLYTINGSSDYSLWKANIRGVDLNVNFDAHWGEGEQNIFYRSDANYIGKCPASEVETKALMAFTNAVKPLVTLSYHSKGEVVYWSFGQEGEVQSRDLRYAKAISRYTGYSLVDGVGSVGGYKDWCIEALGIPSYTIEVGSDQLEHPLPYSEIDNIIAKNIDLPRRLLNTIIRDNNQ